MAKICTCAAKTRSDRDLFLKVAFSSWRSQTASAEVLEVLIGYDASDQPHDDCTVRTLTALREIVVARLWVARRVAAGRPRETVLEKAILNIWS